MSLDFSYSKCGKTEAEREALTTSPLDSGKWHPVGDSLVWLSMLCGYNRITPENVDHVWNRIDIYQRLTGGAIYQFATGPEDGMDVRPLFLTRDDVVRYIGLSTNASARTDAEFWKAAKKWDRPAVTKESAFDWVAGHAARLAERTKEAA